MTAFLCFVFYNSPSTSSAPELIETYANIVVSILTGVVAILGLGYLKPLKDKTKAATFTFWSQISVRIMVIRKWIEANNGVLDNMYSPAAKKEWTMLSPDEEQINQFKEIVQNTLDYIKNANDQMPAYHGWSEDYAKLIDYLGDMLIYDIANSNDYFKFNVSTTDEDRKKYCSEICKTIDKICSEIKKRQKKIEKKII